MEWSPARWGLRWYDVNVTGMEMHAGPPTPMSVRQDALFAATHLMQEVIHIARDHQPHGRGTVGVVQVHPGSAQRDSAGQVQFTADLRHEDAATLALMDQRWRQACAEAGERFRRKGGADRRAALSTHALCYAAGAAHPRASAARWLLPHGHRDREPATTRSNIADVAPTAMIFVPCRDGISHNEIEDAKSEALGGWRQPCYSTPCCRPPACTLPRR